MPKKTYVPDPFAKCFDCDRYVYFANEEEFRNGINKEYGRYLCDKCLTARSKLTPEIIEWVETKIERALDKHLNDAGHTSDYY